MTERVPLDRIATRLQTVINNLGDYVEDGKTPDPYIADAASFATQAKVCVGKQIETKGEGIAPKPATAAKKPAAKKGK